MKDNSLYQYRRSFLPSRIAVLLLIITLSFCCIGTGAAVTAADGSPTDADAALVGLTLPFVQNTGQLPDRPDILYYADLFSGTAGVGHDGISYAFYGDDGGWGLKERFGDDAVLYPHGDTIASTRVNYFIGNDSENWKTGLATYDVLSCGELAPGIGLELIARTGSIEKRFTVAPWYRPSSIVIEVEGGEGLELLPDGSLSVATGAGAILMSAPTAWQDTPSGRTDVQVSYTILAPESYGFAVGPYNPAYPLVIDPIIASTFLGGTGSETVHAITLDYLSEPIVAGYTNSGDFPTTPGALDNTSNGNLDGFVAYLNQDLTNAYMVTYFGGSDDDEITAIMLAGSSICIAGYTASADFPTTAGTFNQTFSGGRDGFVAKFDSGMSALEASTYLGGSGGDYIFDMAYDGYGNNYYLTGYTSSTDFPTAGYPFDTTLDGSTDIFVAEMDSGLSTLTASTYLGGTGEDHANAMALYDNDGSYDIFLTGQTSSSDFPLPELYYDDTLNGTTDAFGARLSGDLSSLQGFTYIGGVSDEDAFDIQVNNIYLFSQSVYICGETYSDDFPTTSGAYSEIYAGSRDAFIINFDLDFSSTPQYSTYVGGTGPETLRTMAVAMDYSEDVVICAAGSTVSPDFPVSTGAYDETYENGEGAIVLMDETLSYLINSTFIGAEAGDGVNCIAWDYSYNIFIAGDTGSEYFPTTAGAYQETAPVVVDQNNAFVSVLDLYLSADIELPVHNIDSGLDYATIQEAIDAAETSDYDTIEVDPGTYYENVDLTRPLTLMSTSGYPSDTVIVAPDPYDHVIEVTASEAVISGFTLAGAMEYTTESQPAGIMLNHSDLCQIFNVETTGNVHGIMLEGSDDNTIEYIYTSYNDLNGITILNSTNNVMNTITSDYNWAGFFVFNSSYSAFFECDGSDNLVSGFYLIDDTETHLEYCTAYDNIENGISAIGGEAYQIANSTVTNCTLGIMVLNASYSTITDSNTSYNTFGGVLIGNTTGDVLTGDSSYHNGVGFYIMDAISAGFYECCAQENDEIGFYLMNTTSVTIGSCDAFDNNLTGIEIEGYDCLVYDSMVSGNDFGVSAMTVGTSFYNNTISDNSVGIRLMDCAANTVFNNYFSNAVNAMDDGQNEWNITPTPGENIIGGPYIAGNWWSDYAGVDLDGDGLGDTLLPYIADGNITTGGDIHPLTEIGSPPTVYVDGSGYWSDIVPYTYSEQPIQEAINDQYTMPGATVEVWSGYYFGAADVNKPLTIVGVDMGWGLPWVQGPGEGVAFVLSAGNTTLSNFTVSHEGLGVGIISDGNTVTNCDIVSSGTWFSGIQILNSADNRIDNCTLHENGEYGIYIDGNSSGNLVADNMIWDNSNGVIIILGPTGNTIERNLITRNLGGGIYIESANANTVRQNSLSGNNYGIIIGPETADNRIYANTFDGNHNEYSNDAGNLASYWVSPGPVAYEYGGVTRTAVLGNYWGNYAGTDANGDGIGDTPYAVGTDSDTAPLVMPWQVYYNGLITEPPAIEWQRASGGSENDQAGALTYGPMSGLIASGWTYSGDGDVTSEFGGADVWIAELYLNGTLGDQESFGGSGDDFAYAMISDIFTGVTVLGGTTSDDGDIQYNQGNMDLWIANLYDPSFNPEPPIVNSAPAENLVWGFGNTIGGSGWEWGQDIAQSPEGYYLVGTTNSTDGDIYYYYGLQDLWFLEVDPGGYLMGSRCVGGSQNEHGNAIDIDSVGDPILAGSTNSDDGYVSGNHGMDDAWLVSMYYGEGWDVDWTRCLGGSGIDCAVGVLALDEGYLVVGYTNSTDGDITSPHGGYDLWVVRTDCSGQIIWQRCYGGSGDDYGTSVTEASDGSGFVITGYTASDDGHVTSNHGGYDLWVLRIGNIGEILWQQTFGGSNDDYGRAIIDQGDGRYLVQGYTLSDDGDVSGNHGMTDYWTLQLAPGASEPPVASFTADPFIGPAPLEVQFADASTGMPDTWAWTFGDGATSTERNPLHTYNESGRYTVRLTVENGEGSDTLVRPEYIKVFAARYALDLDVPGVGVTDMGGFQRIEIDRAVCPGTVTIANDTVTVTNATTAIPQVAYTLVEVNEAGDLVWGDLVRAELTTREMPAIIPGVGIVHPHFIIGLTWIPTAGQVEAGLIGGAGAQDLAAFESAAIGIGSSVDGVAYSLEVSTANLEGCLDGVTLVITMPRSAYDALGGDLKIFRRDDGGVTSVLATTLASLSETEAVFEAFSPNGFSTFASVGLRVDSIQGQDEGEPPAASGEQVVPGEELPPGEEPEAPGEEPGTEEQPDLGTGSDEQPPDETGTETGGDEGIFTVIANTINNALSSLAAIVQEGGARAAGIGDDLADKHVPAEAVLPKDAMAPAAVATSAAFTVATAMVAVGFVATRTAISSFAQLIDRIVAHLRKILDFISNFLGEHVFEHLAEREATMEFLAPLSKVATKVGITQFEVSVVAGGAILYGIAFYLADRVAFFPVLILIYILVTGVAVAVHEFAHHMVAKRYSVHSQVKVYWSGIIVTFFTAWLFGNVFAQPLMTHIPDTEGIDKRHKGIVMAAGPVVSIALACLFLLFIPFGGIWVLAGTVGFSANLLEAVYSLMPFHPLDGKGVAGWNRLFWVLIFLPAIIVYLMLYTL